MGVLVWWEMSAMRAAIQPVRLPSGAPPVVQAEQDAPRGREEGEEQKRDRHGSTAHT